MTYRIDRHGVLHDGVGCRIATECEKFAFAEIERLRGLLVKIHDDPTMPLKLLETIEAAIEQKVGTGG
jgi:hypothetical protein